MQQALGIYGGTFNPVHFGHLALARALRDRFALSEVRLIPTGVPPHRTPDISAAQRLEWLKLSLSGEQNLVADDREVRKGNVSFTFDTLTELQQEQPHSLLVWLIGGDSFAHLPSWYRWQELLEMGHLVVANRPGFSKLPAEIAGEFAKRHAEASPQTLARGKISVLPLPLMPASSTLIREKLARGEDVSDLSPIAAILQQSGLYSKNT
ncbi:nicotinate-nucleotide adenylyltransferase [Iodobacter fluviatilis]|uniref:Probable nicotinate-nucleotide adenylyltransferase n=1 Tax=Iodobacter fluviatilis TaxID=537 RepID=A0A377SWQ4_9NEIS|nr:nicotinate-nucleotide adenylyltransferase [Iodobacter fluviatilis]TCU87903.1 nicotinate-nucleotide adenylyltransferase [Iodobacter fluviatilis]STR45403.1 Nicotinate-nucleotide adenylyltransferase [Iodobacter fluviatilis]